MCFSCGKPGHNANHCPTFLPVHAAGMVGAKGRGWLYDDFTLGSSGASPSGKRRLIWEGTPGFSGSARVPVATPGFVEMPSDDPETDVEDELEYVSP